MSRIVKPSAGETSGGSRGKPSGSSRYSSPPRTNYRKRGGGSGDGSGKWKKSKKKKFGQQKDGAKKEDRKDFGKKEDKGEDKPLSFVAAFAQGMFSLLALSMIAKAGFIVSKAVDIAVYPIAGRLARGMSAWQIPTSVCGQLCGYAL